MWGDYQMGKKGKGNTKFVVLLLVIFLVGWFANDIYYFFNNMNKERPFSLNSNEIKSPGTWIEEDNVILKSNGIIISIKNATWSKFTDTNSMDPVLDVGTHAIKIVPKEPSELSVGDIVSYESEKGIIIHRIIEKGEDEEGVYFITKGDNNNKVDPSKVRFNQVTGVVVGVLY